MSSNSSYNYFIDLYVFFSEPLLWKQQMSAIAFAYLVLFFIGLGSIAAVYFIPRLHRGRNNIDNLPIIKEISSRDQEHSYNYYSDLSNLSKVLAKLEIEIRKHNPNIIVGINRGGMIIAYYIGSRLNIPASKIFEIEVENDKNQSSNTDRIQLKVVDGRANPDFYSDNIVICDDIVRTGTT